MKTEPDRKIVRGRRLRELLDTSSSGLKRFRELPDFPRPLPMPGHPRYYLDEILAWRDGRARAEVAAGAFLQNHAEARRLLDEESHAGCLAELDRVAKEKRDAGKVRLAVVFEALAADVRAAGPTVIANARRLVQRSGQDGDAKS